MVAAPISCIQEPRSLEAARVVVAITLRRAARPKGFDQVWQPTAFWRIASSLEFPSVNIARRGISEHTIDRIEVEDPWKY